MLSTVWGVVRDGKIVPVEPVIFPEGARVLLTVIEDEESHFWRNASQESLKAIWDNPEDDVYAAVLNS